MSAQDILVRIRHSFEQPRETGKVLHHVRSSSEASLAAILADVSALSSALVAAKGVAHPVVSHPNKILRLFALGDVLCFVAAFLAAWGIAAGVNSFFLDRQLQDITNSGVRLYSFCSIVFASLLWFEHSGHYRLRMPFWLEAQKIVSVLGIGMMLDGFVEFAAKESFSRSWLIGSWVFSIAFLIAGRSLNRMFLGKIGKWRVRTLLVGAGSTGTEARKILGSEPSLGYDICAQVENLPYALAQANYSWHRLCAHHNASYVMIALDGNGLTEADAAISQLLREDIPFSVLPPRHQLPVLGMTTQYFFNHDMALLTRYSHLEQPLPRILKRCFDIVVAGAAVLVLSPVLLGLAVAVMCDGGAAFFGHRRLGMKGKVFKCLKFRSMVLNADEALEGYLAANSNARAEWKRDHKLRADPRVTRIGNFLRRSSLDELPQLFNVLKGDMSLVGPRPIVNDEVSKYSHDISYYYRVRPGITGLWQVSGRNDVSYERRVHLDSWYVSNWSFWQDLAILFKTVPVLLKRTGY